MDGLVRLKARLATLARRMLVFGELAPDEARELDEGLDQLDRARAEARQRASEKRARAAREEEARRRRAARLGYRGVPAEC